MRLPLVDEESYDLLDTAREFYGCRAGPAAGPAEESYATPDTAREFYGCRVGPAAGPASGPTVSSTTP